jgi:hypothetical protein
MASTSPGTLACPRTFASPGTKSLLTTYRIEWGSDIASLNSGKYERSHRIRENQPFDEVGMLASIYVLEIKKSIGVVIELSQAEYGRLSARLRLGDMESISTEEAEALKRELNSAYQRIKTAIQETQNEIAILCQTLF